MDFKDVALIMIGAIAASIAYLQWVTAHQRVVVDLFDRRRRAFESLEDALRPIWREAEVGGETLHDFFKAKFECRFLFGQDVLDYLNNLHSDIAWLASFSNDVIDQSQDRSKLIDEKYKRLKRIVNFYESGAPIFIDYLRLDMKMRYFWPLPPRQPTKDSKDDQSSSEERETETMVRTRSTPSNTKYIANDGDSEIAAIKTDT